MSELLLVVAALRRLALYRAVLTEHRTGATLEDASSRRKRSTQPRRRTGLSIFRTLPPAGQLIHRQIRDCFPQPRIRGPEVHQMLDLVRFAVLADSKVELYLRHTEPDIFDKVLKSE